MKVVDPGHVFVLDQLDDDGRGAQPTALVFVKREGEGYPGNVGHHAGTNLQEVIRALISRVKYLDAQIPHENNTQLLVNLRHSLWLLEQRAAERHGRPFAISWAPGIEDLPTCKVCGHIGIHGEHVCRAGGGR